MRAEAEYEPEPYDPYDDYLESGWYDDDVEYRVILIQQDYYLDCARSGWRIGVEWYITKMGLRRGFPSLGVAVCKDGFAEMENAVETAIAASEWVTCQTDEPIE